MKKVFIIFILLIILLSAALLYHYSHQVRPNLMIILIDALRKDHLGCYGYHRNTSPKIDEFARDAIRFQETISNCSWTSPSIASLFTSLYVSSHGLKTHSQKSTDILDLGFETLAEILKKHGYTTSAFITNRWIREEFNYHQGFDVFEQVAEDITRPIAASVRESVIAWLKNRPKKPFFTYIHFMDVHGPYFSPYPYNTLFTTEKKRALTPQEYNKLRYLRIEGQRDLNFYISQYDGAIRYCDYHIGKILEYLKEADLYDDSIIIVTSDHGEAFFEHGECDHGFTLYNEEIEVPLIMRLPSSMDYAINEHAKTQLIDLGVTILDIIGAGFPYEVDGISILLPDDGLHERQRIYSEEYMKGFPKVALIEGNMKYIFHIPEERIVEVYDLNKDDEEKNSLIGPGYPSDAYYRMKKEIRTWLEQKGALQKRISKKPDQAPIDPRTLEQLKSLGYIQYQGENDSLE